MLSSNNIIYGGQFAYSSRKPKGMIIDSNSRADELIGKQERDYKEKLLEEERARRLEEMKESGAEIPEGVDVDEFLGLADAIMGKEEPKEPEIDYVAEAKAEAEKILADANAQANEIISAAEVNAEALKNIARQDGEKEGYNEGSQRAANELKIAKEQLETERNSLVSEYNEKMSNLEREMVEMAVPVFEHVFGCELTDKKEVIYHLLDHCISKIPRSKQMQVKVSETNADFIKSKKEEILEKVGSDVSIDIISDAYLNDSSCIIETDGGIFDCSIDTELDNLIREIKALS